MRLYLLRANSCLSALEEVVDQLGARVAHFYVKRFDTVGKVVEHPHSRDSHEESDGRSDQSFRNTAGDSAQTGRLRGRDRFERVHDADDRSEQTHERSSGTDGGQAADAALQLGMDDGFGTLESTLGSFDIFTRNFRTHLMSFEFLQTGDHNFGKVALVKAIGNFDGFVKL